MAQTTYSLPFELGTFSNGDEAWLTGIGVETITTDPVTADNNYVTYIYSVERRLAANPAYVTVSSGTCTALIDPASSPGDPIQAVRDAESITA